MILKGYDVTVFLEGSDPQIWRDLIIPQNITFKRLDRILQRVFNFKGYHSSQFTFKNSNDSIYEDKSPSIDDYFTCNEYIYYNYDFGDDWWLTIKINKIIEYDKQYATFKDYRGEYNPLEDCGGVGVLNDLIYYKHHPNRTPRDLKDEKRRLRKINVENIQKALLRL